MDLAIHKRGKVLVVHDHVRLRTAMISTLESWGYEVEAAEDNREGLRKAREVSPDLIFCDVGVNGLPCIDLLKTIQAELPQIKFVITGTEFAQLESLRLGACFCLANPVKVSDLRTALFECLGHSIPA
jgi:CheY-like chemotaxis protein